MNSTEVEQINYFKSLTGLRAVAAILVCFHHYNKHLSIENDVIVRYFNESHIGVTIFFVLSGFLITSRYLNPTKKIPLKYYFFGRFSRIYPTFFLITILYFILDPNFNLTSLFYNLTFLKGFYPKELFLGVSQSWSLTVEETFYFSAPILFLLYRRFKNLGYILFFGTMSVVLASLIFISYSLFKENFLNFFTLYTFFGRFSEFLIGSFAYIILKSNKLNKASLTAIGALGVFLSPLALSYFWGAKNSFGILTPGGIIYNNLILPFFVSSFILGLIKEQTAFQSILGSSSFQFLGKSSYCFYLLHEGALANITLAKTNSPLLTALLMYLLSGLIWYFYEEKIRNLIMNSNYIKKSLG